MGDRMDDWRELQALFELIDRTPAPERQSVLESACPDPELRKRVMRMVHGANEASDSTPSPDFACATQRIGPYQVLRVIGSGGIGTVYLGERLLGGAPQRVAVKVLSPHAAGRHFIERFHREQHILGMLDHPNITRLLDAGLGDTGHPYLVMDFVEGVHLDEYCDQESLPVQARVQLFLQVCEAMAYAHRNLVVHLDLKPSNVLVNQQGVVKLLDFGTSKLVQPDNAVTTTILATPAYASPEQLRNEPVTTACDIYSLGAILFYLLTGEVEGGRRSAALAIERAFKGAQPQPLSTAGITEPAAKNRNTTGARLRRILDGDIDTIVAKCLRPQAVDRYASVDALIQDLMRYLEGRPILARPQTALYLAGKFLRRHRLSAALTAALLAALVATGMLASWHEHQALREGRRAQQMQSFLFRLFKMANPDHSGKPSVTVPELLQLGLERLTTAVDEGADRRQLQLGLAESLYLSGSKDQALANFLRIAQNAAKDGDTASEAEAKVFAGRVEIEKNDVAGGRRLENEALALARGKLIPVRVRVLSEVFYAFNEDNNGYLADGNLELLRSAEREARVAGLDSDDQTQALSYLALDLDLRGGHGSEVKALDERLLSLYGDDPLLLCERSTVYGELAWLDDVGGEPAASLPLFRKAYDGLIACSGPDSTGALDQLPYWSDALIRSGRPAEALALLERAMPTWQRLVGSNPDYSDMLVFLSRAYLANGRAAEAERAASNLLTLISGSLAPGDRAIGNAHLVMGQALAAQHRDQEALPHAQAAVNILNRAKTPYGRQWDQQAEELQRQLRGATPDSPGYPQDDAAH